MSFGVVVGNGPDAHEKMPVVWSAMFERTAFMIPCRSSEREVFRDAASWPAGFSARSPMLAVMTTSVSAMSISISVSPRRILLLYLIP